MKIESDDRNRIFLRAWEIIEKDATIPAGEKEGILKLVQALIEASEAAPPARKKDGQARTISKEIISKHSLLSLVKQ